MDTQLEPNKLRAIDLIVQGHNLEEVAKQTGVCSRTLRNWKHEKNFATEMHKRFSNARDEMDAAFLPVIQRIQSAAIELADGAVEWMRSSDMKLRERGFKLQLQLLKWAASRNTRTLTCGIGSDGMVGKYDPYPKLPGFVNLEQLYAEAARAVQQEDEKAEISGNTPRRAGFPACVTSEFARPENSPAGKPARQAPESGKNRKDDGASAAALNGTAGTTATDVTADQPITAPPAPVPPSPQAERGPGGEVNRSNTPDPAAENIKAAMNESGGRGTPAPHDVPSGKAEKSGKPSLKPWQGKGPNHVPIYRKFQRR